MAFGALIAVLIAGGAGPPIYSRLSGGDFYSMPSGSMKPTLIQGDRFVGKPLDRNLRRGDIIVFDHHRNPGVDYVKRVIGLPGDQVQMIDGQVQLNGQALRVEKVEDFEEPATPGERQICRNAPIPDGEPCKMDQLAETLPSGRSYRVLDLGSTRPDNTDLMDIPEGHILTLGDNRDNSVDSRFPSVGFVPIEKVKHLVYMIHTSNDPDTFAPRWDRFFKRLDTE